MAGITNSSASVAGAKHRHVLLGVCAALLMIVSALGTAARALPADLQALPYVPVIVSLTSWFAVLAALALVLALVSNRWFVALVALACVAAQVWWQAPFFRPQAALSDAAVSAVGQAHAITGDHYARVMTLNVFKGQADPQAVVNLVRDERVEVLALQETTDAFVKQLEADGIGDYLPYSQVSSSDGVYGNGLWSAVALDDPVDDEVHSSASFMPAGTVDMGGVQVRFISVHTTSPQPGYWSQWNRALNELSLMRQKTGTAYVMMGDFNATYDHAAFRNILGSRFSDATRQAGHGLVLTWPTNRTGVPAFAGIDHILIDQGMVAGQVQARHVAGSDHAALLATLQVG
ncbi:endonuclease/exonuclease/phosphatase family protein [Bifidobacterium thermophilum]|uniref:endonuclease/exonuclease/phosphatase family protein n=1 Tax=Bifidobacterium thermophilum TaxID=33905 RepID=UPI00309A10B8